MSEQWEGRTPRVCDEHRTTGARAWCLECSEWCYPNAFCKGCEVRRLEAELDALYLDLKVVARNSYTFAP
jgi:hypothetical protein